MVRHEEKCTPELCFYKFDQLEARVGRLEKFIASGVISCAILGLSIMWMVIDLPNKIVSQVEIENGKNISSPR